MGGAEVGPGYEGPDISDFTPDELVRIRNFVSLLGDVGVAATYTVSFMNNEAHELLSAALNTAFRDVSSTCGLSNGCEVTAPESAHEAAPSLCMVVALCPEELNLPHDFIIDDALLQKCLDKYYEAIRQKTSQTAADAAVG